MAVGQMKVLRTWEDFRRGEPFEDLYRFRLMLPRAFTESYTPELMQRFIDLVRPTATKLARWPQVGPLTIAERLIATDLLGSASYLAEYSLCSRSPTPTNPTILTPSPVSYVRSTWSTPSSSSVSSSASTFPPAATQGPRTRPQLHRICARTVGSTRS